MYMLPHQERVVIEKQELDKKISKLNSFIQSEKFKEIPIDEQDRLKQQYSVMSEYSFILGQRIENF